VRMQSTLNRSKLSYNLQAMCVSSNVQCKLSSSMHAVKYMVIAHNLGSITLPYNYTYLSSLRQLAVMVILKETIIIVNE